MSSQSVIPSSSAAIATMIALPRYHEENGDVVVVEGLRHVPFAIARVFVVLAPEGAIRGQHAHKACAQFLTCPVGRVEVLCDDGSATRTFVLDQLDTGLIIPPGVWAQQTYCVPGTVLTVLCDRPYDAEDYIREYAEFLAHRASLRQTGAEQEQV